VTKITKGKLLFNDIHFAKMTDNILIKNAIVVSAGVVFGFTFERALVHIPTSITQQFVFARWIMMKFFLSAMATSFVVMIFSKATSSHFEKARNKRPPQSTASIVLGSLLVGVGMAISGTCPGTAFVQVGAGIPNAIYTILGALTGGLAFSYAFEHLKAFMFPPKLQGTKIEDLLKMSFAQTALSIVMVLGLMLALMEYFVPWKSEVKAIQEAYGPSTTALAAWSPIVSGMIVGLLQFPTIEICDSPLGCSSSYMTVISEVTRMIDWIIPRPAILNNFTGGLNKYWQLPYMAGVMLGGYMSSLSNNPLTLPLHEFSVLDSFFGGFLVIFGSRLASGCPMGHGISGMAMLVANSAIAVAAIFAGAIGTSIMLNI
jgi:uncharacterized membrane protein YedE/YeeE